MSLAVRVIVYGRTIIGYGYNTVSATLRRDSLAIVTMLEPCPMCRGAIVRYNIRIVRILKEKNPLTLMGKDLELYRHYWERVFTGLEGLVDSLLEEYHAHAPDR